MVSGYPERLRQTLIVTRINIILAHVEKVHSHNTSIWNIYSYDCSTKSCVDSGRSERD